MGMSLVEGHGKALGEFNPSSTSEPTENFFFSSLGKYLGW